MPLHNDDIQHLATNIIKGSYNLLIGSESILKKETPGTNNTGDSLVWFCTKVYNSTKDEDDPPITTLSSKKLGRIKNSSNDIRITFKDILSQKEPDFVEQWFEPSLYSLLDIGDFHNIFTLCIDDILEDMLQQICKNKGLQLNVYNFMNTNDIASFITHRREQLRQYGNIRSVNLVYLYGKIDKRIPYVLNDDDAIKAIANLISQKNSGDFAEFLFSKPILSIGCHCEDWRFRFFWYAINGGLPNKTPDGGNDTVVYTNPDTENDTLATKLDSWRVDTDNDSRLFMSTLSSYIQQDTSVLSLLAKRVNNGKYIFLSYCSRDFRLAQEWFERLTARGYNVWIDHDRLHPGEAWDPALDSAIKNCTVFMPLLSPAIVDDLSNGKENTGYIKEWDVASALDKRIFPVSVGNYLYNAPYHSIFRAHAGFSDDHIDPHIKSVKEIQAIDDKLKTIL